MLEKYSKKTTGNRFTQHKQNMTGSKTNLDGEGTQNDFKLEEKVTAESQAKTLMQEGYLNAYVDFYYITTDTTPSAIEISKKMQEDLSLGKLQRMRFDQSEQSLKEISETLVNAEEYHR